MVVVATGPEKLVRILSKEHSNTYNVVLYACCREREKAKYDYLSEIEERSF